jgi:hypothetical protein
LSTRFYRVRYAENRHPPFVLPEQTANLLISPEQMLTIARSGDHFTFFTGLFRGKGPLQGQSGTSI